MTSFESQICIVPQFLKLMINMLTRPVVTKEMVLKTFSNLELSMKKGFGKSQILKTVSGLDVLLPLFPSIELAELVGALTGDGTLSLRNRKIKNGRNAGKSVTNSQVVFFDQNELVRTWFQENLRKVFGVECKVRIKDQSNNPLRFGQNKIETVLELNSSKVVRILKCCGVPDGDKTVNSFNIPLWISEGSKNIKSGFIRGLFNAEGWISNGRIGFLMAKWEEKENELLNFLNNIKTILNEFDIFPAGPWITQRWVRKDGKNVLGIQIAIARKKSVINFKRSIGFIRLDKQSKLSLVE